MASECLFSSNIKVKIPKHVKINFADLLFLRVLIVVTVRTLMATNQLKGMITDH